MHPTFDFIGLMFMSVGGIGVSLAIIAKAHKQNPTPQQELAAIRWSRRSPYLAALCVIGILIRFVAKLL